MISKPMETTLFKYQKLIVNMAQNSGELRCAAL